MYTFFFPSQRSKTIISMITSNIISSSSNCNSTSSRSSNNTTTTCRAKKRRKVVSSSNSERLLTKDQHLKFMLALESYYEKHNNVITSSSSSPISFIKNFVSSSSDGISDTDILNHARRYYNALLRRRSKSPPSVVWTDNENLIFENALANINNSTTSLKDRYSSIGTVLSKSANVIKTRYQRLLYDISRIENRTMLSTNHCFTTMFNDSTFNTTTSSSSLSTFEFYTVPECTLLLSLIDEELETSNIKNLATLFVKSRKQSTNNNSTTTDVVMRFTETRAREALRLTSNQIIVPLTSNSKKQLVDIFLGLIR